MRPRQAVINSAIFRGAHVAPKVKRKLKAGCGCLDLVVGVFCCRKHTFLPVLMDTMKGCMLKNVLIIVVSLIYSLLI